MRACARPTRSRYEADHDCRVPNWATAFRERGLVVIDEFRHVAGVPPCIQEREIKGQMRSHQPLTVVGYKPIERQIDFADENPF